MFLYSLFQTIPALITAFDFSTPINLMYIAAKDHRNNKLELSNFLGEAIFFYPFIVFTRINLFSAHWYQTSSKRKNLL